MADETDRRHEATPYKLQKARERGQASKSRDVVSAAVFTVAMAYMAWRGWPVWREQFQFDQALLLQAARIDPAAQNLWALVRRMVESTLWLGLPFLAALLVVAVIANVAQTGPIFSFTPLKPDFERMNPATNFKNVMGSQLVFGTVRSLLKLVLLSAAAIVVLHSFSSEMRRVATLAPAALMRTLIDDMASLGLKFALVLWLIALLDLAWSRHSFAKKMRMSSTEFKDEIKQREGDPRIRARLRELRRELRKRTAALRNTSKADVLIANPTHVAVALRYEHGKMAAPELVAKGTGYLAAAMRAIAARHGIPVVQSPSLARKLYRELEIERPLPPQYFAEVARIVVWVLAMKRARDGAVAKGVQ
jgi:flagellar biosynthesis protein FlhB